MVRPLFTFASAVSLLFCVGTGCEFIEKNTTVSHPPYAEIQTPGLGFACAVSGLAALAFALARWHQASVEKRRRNGNLCLTCGYDLRATPDCCPECGTVPTGKFKISN